MVVGGPDGTDHKRDAFATNPTLNQVNICYLNGKVY
jgi:hypothetical protein